jgi:predicted ester cyclase
LSFRGSLGAERSGPDSFIDYLRQTHAALAEYRCIIDDLIATNDRAAARMTFTGIHRGAFFGVAATGQRITWNGAAFFVLVDARIKNIWVLGDLDSVKQQLGATRTVPFGEA